MTESLLSLRPEPPLSRRRLLSSKGVNLVGTLAAIALLIYTGTGLIVPLFAGHSLSSGLITAFSLNVALIMLGWRRAKDLTTAISAREQAEARAMEEAAHDYLTGLTNRRRFTGEVEAALKTGAARGLALFDLDFFKKLNDLNGHAAGDQLLREIAVRLGEIVPPGSCCARLGGDEFGVLFPADVDGPGVLVLCEDIRREMSHPFQLRSTVACISASIGVSMLGKDVRDAEAAIRRSDLAMYEAKANGRNAVCIFDLEIELRMQARNQLENEIRAGVALGEFAPFYQPLIDLGTGELVGFEVLARWSHPTRGLLEPADFIAHAEATSLISALSLSVMEQAFIDARAWPSHLKIAVNISPLQFRDPLLSQHILKLLTATGFPGRRLEIELTESAILDDHATATDMIQSLKNSGITVALDDFGTGYASLAQLTSLPFDRIKIDKSFVAEVLSSSQSRAIVDAIAGLGSSLRLPITAEGVESEDIRKHLQDLGCSTAQGWLFGRAADANAINAMLKAQSVGSEQPVAATRLIPKPTAETGPAEESTPRSAARGR